MWLCMYCHRDGIERNLPLVAIMVASPKQSRWQVPSNLMDGTVYQSLFATIMTAQESDGNQPDYVSSAYGSNPDIGSGMNGKEVNKKEANSLCFAGQQRCTYQCVYCSLDLENP